MSTTVRLLLTLPLMAALAACGARAQNPSATAAPPARPVAVAQPAPNPQITRIRGIGRLESADELRLSFKVAGVLSSLSVDAGDPVGAGQLLARLDGTETGAAVSRAATALAKAERDLARADEVFARGLVSREIRDNARSARDIAAADLRSVRFNQQFATVVAPAAGRIKERLAEAGEVIAAGQPVLTMSSNSRGWLLRVDLADREALRLAAGDAADVLFDALPGRRFRAQVARIGGQAEAASGTIEVELSVAADDAPLRSGLVGKVAIAAVADAATLSIPVSALLEANGGDAQVMVVADGRAQLRRIVLGAIAGSRVDVRGGLAADDAVIVGGAAYVDDGERVRIVGE